MGDHRAKNSPETHTNNADLSDYEPSGKDSLISCESPEDDYGCFQENMKVNEEVISTHGEDKNFLSPNDAIVNCVNLMPSPLMNIDISISGKKLPALIDTGASTNMIRKSLVDQLGINIIQEHRVLKGIGNKEVRTFGMILTDFSFYNVGVEETPFHVVSDQDIRVPVILGFKFCSKTKLIIDIADRKISKLFEDGSQVDIYLHEKDSSVKRVIHEAVKVFASKTYKLSNNLDKVDIHFECNKNGLLMKKGNNMLFESRQQDNSKATALDGIIDVNAKENFILMQKASHCADEDVIVRKGEFLGLVNSIIELENEEEQSELDWSWERLKDEVSVGHSITSEEQNKLYDILIRAKESLSRNEDDIGCARVTPQHIKLTDKTPIWQRARRFAELLNK